jgi:hypothetical protein
VCELNANKSARLSDRFTSHTLPQTVVGTSQNGVKFNLKDSGKRSKSERCLEIKFFRKKTPEPGAISRILSHRKEVMLQLQITISPSRDISPDITDQIPSKGASKTGKYSVAILKIGECPS